MALCSRTPRKLPILAVLVVVMLAILVVVDFTYNQRETSFYLPSFQLGNITDHPSVLNEASNVNTFKQILLWNSPHRIEASAFGTGYQAFLSNGCNYKHCIILTNASLVNLLEIDAILINMHELWLSKVPDFQRQPFQRFVFFTQESPTTMPINSHDFNNFFNWTMSFRRDSDIGLLYGRVTPKQTFADTDHIRPSLNISGTTDYTANKTKLVAWFASHCDTASQREKYVQALQKYVPVDVYGGCGNLSCKRNHADWLSYPECYDMLENTYKFYLSFENSLCTDYVTEKFFNVLQRQVVPVVYGGANYSQIAPEHSYIDANVLSPKELASLLTSLDKNDTLYNEYFWWKEYYDVEAGVEQMSRHAFCDLCQKLHTDSETKVYDTMATQWDPSTQCTKPRETF